MLVSKPQFERQGTTMLECAVIFPLTFMLLLGLVVGAMGILRFQEVAALARAGARYASTHGAQYRKDAGQTLGNAGTSAGTKGGFLWYAVNPLNSSGADTSWAGDIYDKAIRPSQVALDPTLLSCQIGWPPVINQASNPDNWPGSRVSVTVAYQWMPEIYFFGPINLTSTSTMAITN